MSIATASNALASDFINEAAKNSTPATDAGRVAKLETNAKIAAAYIAPVIAKQLTIQNSPASTTETTVLTYTIAAGVLATGNGMRFRGYITTGSGGVSATTTIRLKLGSTTLISIVPPSTSAGWVELIFFNNGGTAVQAAFGTYSDATIETSATGTGAESTTSSKTLLVTCQLSNSLGSYSVQFQTLEVL